MQKPWARTLQHLKINSNSTQTASSWRRSSSEADFALISIHTTYMMTHPYMYCVYLRTLRS